VPLTISEPAGIEAKQPPTFFNNPPPRYPELAKQRGWEGDVLLRLMIDETGKVTEVTVERTSGYKILDAAAVNAIRLWRAEPSRRFGRAVKTVEYLPVQFRK
jgi:protein TonB